MITFKKTDAACVCMFARVCVILAEADKDLRWRKVDIILNYAENLRRVNKFFAFNHIILKYGAMDAFEELAQKLGVLTAASTKLCVPRNFTKFMSLPAIMLNTSDGRRI